MRSPLDGFRSPVSRVIILRWILSNAFWRDDNVWRDDATWTDGA